MIKKQLVLVSVLFVFVAGVRGEQPQTGGFKNRQPDDSAEPAWVTPTDAEVPNDVDTSLVEQASFVQTAASGICPVELASSQCARDGGQPENANLSASSCGQPTYRCPEVGSLSSVCGCRGGGPLWLRADVLLWGLGGAEIPPLVTSSPVGTTPADVGVIGRPATQTVFGGESLSDDLRVGSRIRSGLWFDQRRMFGIEGDLLFLEDEDEHQSFSSADMPLLARPFYNSNTLVNAADSEFLNGASIVSAALDFNTTSEVFSAAPSMRWNLACQSGCQCSRRIDFLVGYRYFKLDESIRAFESVSPQGAFFAPGTRYEFSDQFDVENRFHGTELGLSYLQQNSRWLFGLTSRIAFGQMQSTYTVDGSTRAVIPGVLDNTIAGGFLTAGSQLGTFSRDAMSVLPQAEILLGYYLTPRLRWHVAYNFLYLDSVIHAGSLIPTEIDSDTFLSAASNPTSINASAVDSGVWLQGINLGITFDY